ncbi:hypothetical protein INR49_023782 [Caranx melampygus]|nr:hypothetical protein INR49_023782 [Caranx melampygus]
MMQGVRMTLLVKARKRDASEQKLLEEETILMETKPKCITAEVALNPGKESQQDSNGVLRSRSNQKQTKPRKIEEKEVQRKIYCDTNTFLGTIFENRRHDTFTGKAVIL